MTSTKLLVTGASGQLARLAIQNLLDAGARGIIATTRKPESLADLTAKGVEVRRADFDDPSSLTAAFAGVTRALLVSTDALDVPGRRLKQHQNAITALERAGAAHVVYTSLPNPLSSPVSFAPDHAGTEAALHAAKLDHTILRNNLYAELLFAVLPGAVASGKLYDARGDGRVAWLSRDDAARAAASALLGAQPGRRTFDVTGPDALSSKEVAAIASAITGRPIEHVSVPVSAAIDGMTAHGLPRPIAEVYASIDVAIAQGLLGQATNTVAALTGRPGRSVRDILAASRGALGV